MLKRLERSASPKNDMDGQMCAKTNIVNVRGESRGWYTVLNKQFF